MAQTGNRQTEMEEYLRSLYKVADSLKHDQDRVKMLRGLRGLKQELDIEYSVGEACPHRKGHIRKSIDKFRELVKSILAPSMRADWSGRQGHKYLKREIVGTKPDGSRMFRYHYTDEQGKSYASEEKPLHHHYENNAMEHESLADFYADEQVHPRLKGEIRIAEKNNPKKGEKGTAPSLTNGVFTYKHAGVKKPINVNLANANTIAKAYHAFNDYVTNLKNGDTILANTVGGIKHLTVDKVTKKADGSMSKIIGHDQDFKKATVDIPYMDVLTPNGLRGFDITLAGKYSLGKGDSEKDTTAWFDENKEKLAEFAVAPQDAMGDAKAPDIKAYLKEWDGIKDKLDENFSKFVDPKTEKEADQLFLAGKTSGINVTKYSVFHKTEFNDFFSKEKKFMVTMYNQPKSKEYTEKLLQYVREKVGDVPYAVAQRASKFEWKPEWGDAADGMKVGEKIYERAGEHNIVFVPQDDETMKKLSATVARFQDRKAHLVGDIRRDTGWDVPDNRSNSEVEGLERAVMNYKVMPNGKVVTTMTQESKIADVKTAGFDFRAYQNKPVWVNPKMKAWMYKSIRLIIDLMKSNG